MMRLRDAAADPCRTCVVMSVCDDTDCPKFRAYVNSDKPFGYRMPGPTDKGAREHANAEGYDAQHCTTGAGTWDINLPGRFW